MGKKDNLSRKERKELQRQREEQRHNDWLSQFQVVGVHSDEELVDLLFGDKECVELEEEERENGFPDYAVWDTYHDKDASPEVLHIFEYHGKYIFWNSGCFAGGECYDPIEEDLAMLFDTLDEARQYRDNQPKGEKAIMEQIFDCKETLGDDGFYFKADAGTFHHNYNVFYNRDLILENLSSLENIDYLKEVRDRYQNFKNGLKTRGVTLNSIEKRPREWNRNERFYDYEIEYKDQSFTLSGQILSRMQHQTRETIGLFPEKDLERFIHEVDAGDPYPGLIKKEKEKREKEWKEYQTTCEAAYQGIPHGDGISAIPLEEVQKTSLLNFLESRRVMYVCDGTLKYTVEWAINKIPEENRPGVLETIRQNGGYCDCEVIMNYLMRHEYFPEEKS